MAASSRSKVECAEGMKSADGSDNDEDSQATQLYQSEDSQKTLVYQGSDSDEDSQATQVYESEDSQDTLAYPGSDNDENSQTTQL